MLTENKYMFSRAPTNTVIERFIGALTMALGFGSLIPRKGFGLYALLEESGDRVLWSLVMLSVGCWAIAASYLRLASNVRLAVLFIIIGAWFAIGLKFIQASLWGAALQAGVIELFAIETFVRIILERKQHASETPNRN